MGLKFCPTSIEKLPKMGDGRHVISEACGETVCMFVKVEDVGSGQVAGWEEEGKSRE